MNIVSSRSKTFWYATLATTEAWKPQNSGLKSQRERGRRGSHDEVFGKCSAFVFFHFRAFRKCLLRFSLRVRLSDSRTLNHSLWWSNTEWLIMGKKAREMEKFQSIFNKTLLAASKRLSHPSDDHKEIKSSENIIDTATDSCCSEMLRILDSVSTAIFSSSRLFFTCPRPPPLLERCSLVRWTSSPKSQERAQLQLYNNYNLTLTKTKKFVLCTTAGDRQHLWFNFRRVSGVSCLLNFFISTIKLEFFFSRSLYLHISPRRGGIPLKS